MDKSLSLQLIFSALDKLSGPLDRMRKGSKGLTADIVATRKEIRALGEAQKNVAAYKIQQGQYKKRAAEIETARAATAKWRAEIAATEQPTIRMEKQLARAEKREQVLTEQHKQQGAALGALSDRLQTAGVDVTNLSDHEARLADRMRGANTSLDQQSAKLVKMERARARGEKLQNLGGSMAQKGAIATAAVSVPLIMFFRESAKAAMESRDAQGQVEASLASMGNAAQRTLPQLSAQAKALQHVSTFDDDDILRNVTTGMLTFDKISGPVFDRAQAAAVNLSAKFKKDLQSSTMMVGKALQDPVKGLTALSKIGVSFTAIQKTQIQTMVAAGNTAGAQAIIMGELERQTNGAAEAARKASPGAEVVDQWRDFQETTGDLVISILPPLTDCLKTVLEAFNNLSPGTKKVLVIIAMLAVVVGPLIGILGGIMTAVGGVAAVFSIGLLPAAGIILAVIAAVALLGYAAYQIYANWEPIKAYFLGLWTRVQAAFAGPLGAILTALFPIIGVPLWIYRNWNKLPGMLASVWASIKSGAMDGVTFFLLLPSKLMAIGGQIIQGLINGVAGKMAELKNTMMTMAQKLPDWMKKVLNIQSPSRVFMGIGGHVASGLALGIDRGGGAAIKNMSRIATGLTGAAAISLAGPAMAATPAMGSPQARAGTSGTVIHNNITIQIAGASAGDPKAAALAIKRELDALLAVDARGAYHDV